MRFQAAESRESPKSVVRNVAVHTGYSVINGGHHRIRVRRIDVWHTTDLRVLQLRMLLLVVLLMVMGLQRVVARTVDRITVTHRVVPRWTKVPSREYVRVAFGAIVRIEICIWNGRVNIALITMIRLMRVVESRGR